MNNIWNQLPSGFLALAPMEDVTDTVFRQMVRSFGDKIALEQGKTGKDAGVPEVFFTEFTNCDGIQSIGQSRVIHRLKYEEPERPLIAQIWGKTPENYEKTASLICELGFDGVDINMGCPEKNVLKQGACGALIQNPQRAKEILEAVKRGINGQMPISVKTRIGFKEIETKQWCGFLLDLGIDALTVHGRTVKELSDVPAHWDEINKVVQMRTSLGLKTKIIGNGDVADVHDAQKKIDEFGVDGVMIGRGIFKNPFTFNREVVRGEKGELYRKGIIIDPTELLQHLIDHTRLWQRIWAVNPEDSEYYTNYNPPLKYKKNIATLKKFYKIYCQGFAGSSELRIKIMEADGLDEIVKTILQAGYEVQ